MQQKLWDCRLESDYIGSSVSAHIQSYKPFISIQPCAYTHTHGLHGCSCPNETHGNWLDIHW